MQFRTEKSVILIFRISELVRYFGFFNFSYIMIDIWKAR